MNDLINRDKSVPPVGWWCLLSQGEVPKYIFCLAPVPVIVN